MKKNIKKIVTPNDIDTFLKNCGFEKIECGGCPEYLKDIENENDYVFQIGCEQNGIIESAKDKFVFCENGKEPTTHPLARYSKTYDNFQLMIIGEIERCNFKDGLNKL